MFLCPFKLIQATFTECPPDPRFMPTVRAGSCLARRLAIWKKKLSGALVHPRMERKIFQWIGKLECGTVVQRSLDNCPVGQVSRWTNVSLDNCPVGHLSRQKFWEKRLRGIEIFINILYERNQSPIRMKNKLFWPKFEKLDRDSSPTGQ